MTNNSKCNQRLCDRLNCDGTNELGEECRDISHFDELNEARRYWK